MQDGNNTSLANFYTLPPLLYIIHFSVFLIYNRLQSLCTVLLGLKNFTVLRLVDN